MPRSKIKIIFSFTLLALIGGFFLLRSQKDANHPAQESAIANSLSYPELRDLENKTLSFLESGTIEQ